MKIALAGYRRENDVRRTADDEDTKLITHLRNKGWDIQPQIWNDAEVQWQGYDLVIIKSTWDYHYHIDPFYKWLNTLEAIGVKVLNPLSIIRWNSDKHYLKEISADKMPVIPSLFIEKGETPDITSYFEKLDTTKLIVKPCVSGGSKKTYAIMQEEVSAIEPALTELLLHESLIVQPFIPEIETGGEWSFIFLHGVFSHCIIKRPQKGDFRVQYLFGGTVEHCDPPEAYINQATAYITKYAKDCLYGRVDGLIHNGAFLLMELELIEPFLFLSVIPNGYENYHRALSSIIS